MTWAPLPYGSFTTAAQPGRPRVGVRLDGPSAGQVLDLTAAAAVLLPTHRELFVSGTLDPLLAATPDVWREVRDALLDISQAPPEQHLVEASTATMQLPFTVGDYVDFYASEHHAANLGRLFRPGTDPLTPNWKHMPIGYHGRSGTVVVSGTPIRRPRGQLRSPDGAVTAGAAARLDIEVECGFVVGTGSPLGIPVDLADAVDHIFGVCLVNDWSARDIQAWEYVPLGPFLGKSFATSISPWITPLAALDAAWVAPPPRDVPLLPYLEDAGRRDALDISFTARLNGEVICRPPLSAMYWTPAQMLTHMTANGASTRPGDLFASGTVSGPERSQWGSLIELSQGGREPIGLADGSTRAFLADGDEVAITATAPGPGGTTVDLGEVAGRITAA